MITHVEVIGTCFDFESGASASPTEILRSRSNFSRKIHDFGRESRNIPNFGQEN